jgi:ATP-dependent RNA helicase RhlE
MTGGSRTSAQRLRPTPERGGFAALGLCAPLCDAVQAAGYDDPTPIQLRAIPIALDGRDVLGCAQTGTGKTAAFALPILQQLLTADTKNEPRHVRALVLAPTRELAAQIAESFRRYAARTSLRCQVVFGGVGKQQQIAALRRPPDVLVATPGRLIDLLQDRALRLDRVRHAVLDEADRMLDMGFINDVRRIFGELPERRQTLMFSATMPKAIEQLASRILTRPQGVAVDPVASTCAPIAQGVYFVEQREKRNTLVALLGDPAVERALVFTRTKHGANRVSDCLERAKIAAAAIHGNKSQSARERALAEFKSGELRVLVATDIASRGIDVLDISHVVNFDLPVEPEVYVHRVGRTGRAGKTGIAVSLCSGEERPRLQAIERLTRRQLERLDERGLRRARA